MSLTTELPRTLFTLPGRMRQAPAPEAQLLVLAGPQRGLSFPLPCGATCVGRGSGNAAQLGSDTVSKAHARVDRTGEGCVVEDLGSRNGTRVRGIALASGRPQTLRHGDTLEVGDVVLLFCDAGAGLPRRALGPLRLDTGSVQAEVDALLADLRLPARRAAG